MAIQCFTILRALRATAHHTSHRLAGHNIHHAHRALMHGVASLHATKLPAVVCVVTGLAAVGVSGFVAGSKLSGSPAPSEIGSTTNTPLPFGASGVESLLTSLIASVPSEIGSWPDTPFSYDWRETGNLPDSPSTFAWSEIGSPLGAPPSFVWSEIGGLSDIPSPSESGGSPDTPTQSAAVAEPASISILGASLFAIAVLRRRNRTRFGTQAVSDRTGSARPIGRAATG